MSVAFIFRPVIFRTVERSTLNSATVADRRYNGWLNRFAWFTAFATLLLICSGGMVTSKGVGLAVPDWPTTFGYNMFLFPVSKWIGGVLFEHTHRLIASAVGFLTIILAIWLWRSDDRPWACNLGVIALAGVIVQGILGGLRVTMLKDEIGIFHACLAQAFLGLIVVIALMTTNFWRSLSNLVADDASLPRIGHRPRCVCFLSAGLARRARNCGAEAIVDLLGRSPVP